jgi:hypothetical protein
MKGYRKYREPHRSVTFLDMSVLYKNVVMAKKLVTNHRHQVAEKQRRETMGTRRG